MHSLPHLDSKVRHEVRREREGTYSLEGHVAASLQPVEIEKPREEGRDVCSRHVLSARILPPVGKLTRRQVQVVLANGMSAQGQRQLEDTTHRDAKHVIQRGPQTSKAPVPR